MRYYLDNRSWQMTSIEKLAKHLVDGDRKAEEVQILSQGKLRALDRHELTDLRAHVRAFVVF